MKEPSDCGTSAVRNETTGLQSKAFFVDPLLFHKVSTWLTRIVPFGVTDQDCVADGPPDAIAVTVKLFAVRDCAAVGIQEIVLPLSVAPVGALDRKNVTPVPLAAT